MNTLRPITAIDHVQLAMSPGQEDAARRFYVDVLGLTDIPKPTKLAKRGGCWFESGTVQVHLGGESDFKPSQKSHPAFRCSDYEGLLRRLSAAGVAVKKADDVPGIQRCHILDPFGNRIELINDDSQ